MYRGVTPVVLAGLLTAALGAFPGAQSGSQAPAATVSFINDVQPILEKNCLSCHGESMRMGQLDLRNREARWKAAITGRS